MPVGDGDGRSAGNHLFGADPEVGRDLAAVDWSATPLGPPDTWPQSLQTAVSILLSSRFSMWMAWGPELTFFCNAAYRRDTLGSKYPWALGRPASDVWAEIWDDIGPRIDRVLSTGEATWDAGLRLFLRRSGYTEETYHTFSYSPLHDDDGRVVGMLCVVSEVTEQVISERRLATLRDLGSDPSVLPSERQLLAAAADQLGRNLRDLPFTLTYLYDDAGVARLAAASGIAAGHRLAPATLPAEDPIWPVGVEVGGTLVDLSAERFAGAPTGDWPDPPLQALVIPLVQQGADSYGFFVAALNCYRPFDESYRGFVELVAGHLAAEIGSARSYRAQQRRAEELAELDRAKTAFFSNISHEFRTPLTLILGPVSELRTRVADDGDRDELEVVHRNALRLSKLVNTLLDFSRIEAGRMQAHYRPVDLAAVTGDLASVFRSAADRAGLQLVVDCAPLDEPVYIDQDMWEKVILNLVSNALKFTFEGSITVRVQREGRHALVTVADTGVGVPAAEMPRLFERFHRIENARSRSNEGSGIGLALVKELVGLHGGTITAESTEAKGTTFAIRLPFGAGHLPAEFVAAADTPRAASAAAEPYLQEALRWVPGADTGAPSPAPLSDAAVRPVSVAGPPPRVLVADDNADMREYLVRLLSSAGYLVDAVQDGRQALEVTRAQLPELVVSDVMMPQLDGLGLVAALRADPRTAATPVLLLSARAGQEAAIEGLQAGADDYLVKPFAAAELLARVRVNVELARLRNHHARWRTALVESLQEAFFVCDEHGAVIEINAAFTDILGYGPEGLPYPAVQPWWPDAEAEPQAHEEVVAGFRLLLEQPQGTFTVPVTHRDGHRLWVTVSFNHAADPDTGRRVTVGTLRDVTAEHYRVQRQTTLAELNHLLAQADTVEDAVRSTVAALRRVWQARRVLAVTFPSQGAATGPEVVVAGDPVDWPDLPAAARQRIGALRDGDLLSADVVDRSAAAIALQHPRGVLVLWIELSPQRPFGPPDQTLLTLLAGRLGQGLQRVHTLDQQRETALALQHAILGPAQLPGGFAARYQPASRPLQVGGDWFDVVDLDDGRIALIVGDCVGHGLAAATVMGQLRSACRALLLEQPSPSGALSGLDRFAARLPGASCTTAFCAVIDTDTGELTYSSAGHPPPILVEADLTTRTLEDGRAIPLGIRTHTQRPEARVTIPPRATLLLYTDGLVERRRQSLDQGIERAAGLVREDRTASLEELASTVMAGLEPAGGYQDDVALLLYRQPAPLQIDFPPHVRHVAATRTALRRWLARADVDAEQVQSVLIAAGEAVANAIEHGHRDRPDGVIRLRASAHADRLQVSVIDSGRWKPRRDVPDISRGRGLDLMRALMHDVTIDTDDSGTTVHLFARITG
ncbi:SpoIIE family protein phosphatase [Mycobacterium sp. MYCO198283]|uniref:SpoIIE family protein phosphatase n=1 Tax=Mycobacterium sp. MYCO198283 TaxID=2883505 RepID=UPI001E540E90|nr:SpoIIE family protein phosphatase [Mycobacterium sp. MYCO198283]MCG5433294.1 SpoIIE family protein phosphatase [Mycobacterium sp. MYCO198283]